MRLRPILFSAPMVRALLASMKTQTRRAVPERVLDAYYAYDEWVNAVRPSDMPSSREYERGFFMNRCPYGYPDDQLWVRETWAQVGEAGHLSGYIRYRADEVRALGAYGAQKWKPSIFMPRAASRILLEVVSVRVEQLQDISEVDAIAEGVERVGGGRYWLGATGLTPRGTAREAYRDLWESINGAGSWDENPWVWVIEFKRLAP